MLDIFYFRHCQDGLH